MTTVLVTKKWWEGKKTHVANWINAAAIVGFLSYLGLSPEQAMGFLDQFWGWVVGGEVLMGIVISWFRHLGNKREEEAT